MTLHPPFIITARLLPGVKIGGAFISLERDGTTRDNRDRFRWTIDLPDAKSGFRDGGFTGNDLCSGCGGCTMRAAFESLFSFLAACAESYAHDGDNAGLFPPAVAEWASQNSDELSMLSLELEETDKPLIEE